MPFESHTSFTKARIGTPISLGRAHIDALTITLTFIYQQLVEQDGIWAMQEKRQMLRRNVHYKLDRRRGIIVLMDHPFWQHEGRWRAADRVEPLLYKAQVKHPQRIEFNFEHYRPEETDGPADWDEVDEEAKGRLGYDVPRYAPAAEPSAGAAAPFDWD